MAQPTIRAEIDKTLDRELYFAAQVTFDGVLSHLLTNALYFSVVQVFHFLAIRYASGVANFACAAAPNAIDRSQPDLGVLMRGDVDAGDTSHNSSLSRLVVNQPWRCLWRGSVQITRTTPWRLMILQLRQMRLTDANTFMVDSW